MLTSYDRHLSYSNRTTYSSLGFSILIAMIIGNQQYWKGKFESLNEERGDGSGWREEARFLRRMVNKTAAKEVEKEY